jgi:hypothetical protein
VPTQQKSTMIDEGGLIHTKDQHKVTILVQGLRLGLWRFGVCTGNFEVNA